MKPEPVLLLLLSPPSDEESPPLVLLVPSEVPSPTDVLEVLVAPGEVVGVPVVIGADVEPAASVSVPDPLSSESESHAGANSRREASIRSFIAVEFTNAAVVLDRIFRNGAYCFSFETCDKSSPTLASSSASSAWARIALTVTVGSGRSFRIFRTSEGSCPIGRPASSHGFQT